MLNFLFQNAQQILKFKKNQNDKVGLQNLPANSAHFFPCQKMFIISKIQNKEAFFFENAKKNQSVKKLKKKQKTRFSFKMLIIWRFLFFFGGWQR